MEYKKRFYISFAKILPKKYREYISKILIYGGERELTSDEWLGPANLLALLGFIGFLITPFSLYGAFKISFLSYGLLFIFCVHLFIFLVLYFKMEDRKNRIENALPDLMYLTATNIRAGMSPFKALRYSAKKEFGPLKEEIEYVSSRAMGAINFSEVLMGVSRRIKSELLERTLRLFSNAIKSGGQLAQLSEDIASDIIETRTLKKELVTSTRAYVMFILFIIIIGTPLLLAIGLTFLNNIIAIQPTTPTAAIGGVEGIIGEIKVTQNFIFKISIIMLILTSILASILIGVIKEGNYFYGFRYALFIVMASLIMFFILRFIIGGFLG